VTPKSRRMTLPSQAAAPVALARRAGSRASACSASGRLLTLEAAPPHLSRPLDRKPRSRALSVLPREFCRPRERCARAPAIGRLGRAICPNLSNGGPLSRHVTRRNENIGKAVLTMCHGRHPREVGNGTLRARATAPFALARRAGFRGGAPAPGTAGFAVLCCLDSAPMGDGRGR
jgi:hypothetical protein